MDFNMQLINNYFLCILIIHLQRLQAHLFLFQNYIENGFRVISARRKVAATRKEGNRCSAIANIYATVNSSVNERVMDLYKGFHEYKFITRWNAMIINPLTRLY